MCGIVGFAETRGSVDIELLVRATRLLRHRGPDAEGFLLANTRTGFCLGRWSSPGEDSTDPPNAGAEQAFNLGFGFRRLAILDREARGNQPMHDPDQSYWVVFNGEIYNYLELRSELETLGCRFRTATDTEVLLYAYREWGLDCLSRLNGMWAFAIWDVERRRLICSRDRFGIKPLYYTTTPNGLRFASEVKSLLVDPSLRKTIDVERLADFLVDGRVDHHPDTLFQGVHQIPPAQALVWELTDRDKRPSAMTYWHLDPNTPRLQLDDDAAAQHVYDGLEESIRLHLRSDVPVGTCLSGGLDSSSIVSITSRLLRQEGVAAEQIGERQRTFTSCFDDPRFDERGYASAVARWASAEENQVLPTGDGLLEELPKVIWHQDQPFGSTSIYAQWSVFRRASDRGVKVILDGQGGDELFAGYGGYDLYLVMSLLRRGRFFGATRELIASIERTGDAAGSIRSLLSSATGVWGRGFRRRLRAAFGRVRSPRSRWFNEAFLAERSAPGSQRQRTFDDVFEERLFRELHDGLPALLRYEDRDSMAFSVEARVPFLDHRLVELAFSLPGNLKIRGGETKYVLRRAMHGKLPEEVRTRKDKMGFVTPEVHWFQQHLGARAMAALASPHPVLASLIQVDELRGAAGEARHRPLPPDHQTVLWRVLNVSDWIDVIGL